MRTLALCAPLFALAACASPIVGGACQDGYTDCHGSCIDTHSDPDNCGGCGNVCPAGMRFCVAGACSSEAGMPDAGMDGSAEMGPRDLGPDLDFDGGYHVPPCNIGELRCGSVCVPVLHDPLHCGSCTNACGSGSVCAGGSCMPTCASPLTLCSGECVDTTNDALNCMTCGNACPSGICIASACSMGVVGHVVLIGHDYAHSIPDEDLVLGNAVLISVARPIRLLTFPGSARAMAVTGADNAVDTTAMARGATVMRTSALVADEVPLRLASADVFLIYAQRDAIDSDLATEGTSWGTALHDFVVRGGVVIALDDDSATNAGTWQVLERAGLITNTSRTVISGTDVHIVAGGDQVATGLPTMYRGQTATVRFDSTDMVKVIDDGMGNPVVIHRTVTP